MLDQLTDVHRQRLKLAAIEAAKGRDLTFQREDGGAGKQLVWYRNDGARQVVLASEGPGFGEMCDQAQREFGAMLSAALEARHKEAVA